MKFSELCAKLHFLKVKVIYVSHEEKLGFTQNIELNRFAHKLRANGFFPLIARDFRLVGTESVNKAIDVSQYVIIVAFEEKTVEEAKKKGVAFVMMNEALE